MSRVTSQPVFVSGQKNWVRVRYFLGWVGLGLQILTRLPYLVTSNKVGEFLQRMDLAHKYAFGKMLVMIRATLQGERTVAFSWARNTTVCA